MEPDRSLEDWIETEYSVAACEMLRSVSATGLVHRRPGFGQEIRPVTGSVLASPVSAHYDPEPDYFFHWQRDAAVVMSAVGDLIDDGTLGDEGHAIVSDFVNFSLALDRLDGRMLAADPRYGAAVAPDMVQFLRPREEMARVFGDGIRMEPRFNPDGTLDILRWGRPQLDGPALRALVLMRHAARRGGSPEMTALVGADVDFTLRQAGSEGYDIWEERVCADYYTRRLQQRTLAEAALAADAHGDHKGADALAAAATRLTRLLDGHWSPERGCYLSAVGRDEDGDRNIDFAVVLAALHGGPDHGAHSVADPRTQATFAALCRIFARDYAINRDRADAAPAMGRYRGDVYQSGGAFYFSTLGAAEFHYRLAATIAGDTPRTTTENMAFVAQAGLAPTPSQAGDVRAALVARGDAFMETVRRFTPTSGALSEQFDQTDGRQTSARRLAWSYAAFISAAARRRAVTRPARAKSAQGA